MRGVCEKGGEMSEFVGLPGVRGGRLRPRGKHTASTVSGFMDVLRTGRICSGAGDNGAITVWRDDKGAYRCEFSRFCISISSAEVISKAAVKRWLKDWLPQMQETGGRP